METTSSATLIDEAACKQFESQWKSGSRTAIETHLPPEEDPRYLPTLEKLVLLELELAWKEFHGTDSNTLSTLPPLPRVEDYLRRFELIQPTGSRFKTRPPESVNPISSQLPLPDGSRLCVCSISETC